MNVILLSGGSGKRLWPLSNDAMSKQFLKVLQDEQGGYQSMVQRVFGQLKNTGLHNSVTIAANISQLDSIQNQIGGQADVVLEPERRNTFPAIALSCAYLYYKKKKSTEDTVVVLPVDPYVEDEYFTNFIEMERALHANAAEIVLMGAIPTYPSAKYGYILTEPADSSSRWKKVTRFKEKPSEAQAESLIREGALWNCGVFAFKLGFIMDLIDRVLPCSSYEELYERYGELHAESFDYEVLEKTDSIAVVEYTGIWKDLGTWNTLTEQMNAPTLGKNIIVDDATENTHIINVRDLPVIVMGAKNMVVVASHDGVLVSDKHESSYLRPYAEQTEQRPMYESRRWGNYRVIDQTANNNTGERSLTKRLMILAGRSFSCRRHENGSKCWTVISGTGKVVLDGHMRLIKPGDLIRIPEGSKHTVQALTPLEIIEVQIGNGILQEDAEYSETEWKD